MSDIVKKEFELQRQDSPKKPDEKRSSRLEEGELEEEANIRHIVTKSISIPASVRTPTKQQVHTLVEDASLSTAEHVLTEVVSLLQSHTVSRVFCRNNRSNCKLFVDQS